MSDLDSVEGVIFEIEEKETKTGKKMYTLTVNTLDQGRVYVSGFGSPIKLMREASKEAKVVRVTYRLSSDGKYKNYHNVTLCEQKPEPKKIEKPFGGGGSKADPDFPGADKLDYWHFIEGEMVSYARTGLKAFRGVFGREPKSDGEFRVMGNMMMFSAYHWPVELFKRSRGCKTVDEVYKEALLKKNGDGDSNGGGK